MNSTKISLLCPSFDHEKFVKQFIESVLNQSEQNFELIIVDDFSSDGTVEKIKEFSDSRIKLIKHSFNEGINSGLNDAFNVAKGEYCVFIASDDTLEPNHLKTAIEYLDNNKNTDIFYCSLNVIDENNNIIEDKDNIYTRSNNDRFDLLQKMFFEGNQLFSPGVVIRKSAMDKIMPLKLGMLQYQDYAMHVELLINSQMYQSTQKLVNYRIISGDKNTSARTKLVEKREALEEAEFMNSFLKIQDPALLCDIFKGKIDKIGTPTKETIPYFLGRLAMLSEKEQRNEWGYRVIQQFISEKENFELLNRLYGFDFKSYLGLVNDFKSKNKNELKMCKKLEKYKLLFKIFLTSTAVLSIIFIIFLIIK